MQRPSKISISKISTRSGPRWQVRYRDPADNAIKRPCFELKAAAEKFADGIQNQNRDAVAKFSTLRPDDQAHLLQVWREARKRGVDLMAGVINAKPPPVIEHELQAVINEIIVAKRLAVRDARYLAGLENLLNRFAAGHEKMDFKEVNLAMVKEFLKQFGIDCQVTYRSRLSTLFKFGMIHGYRDNNPCTALEEIKRVVKSPRVLTVPETRILLKFLLDNPFHPFTSKNHRPNLGEAHVGLAWFLLTAFAGLRPEEAMLCEPRRHFYLDAAKPYIEITPDICKTGQWRMVYPLPAVVTALKWALAHGSIQPFDHAHYKRLLLSFREALCWKEWPQSITRHSGCSYWLAMVNDQRHVAEMLGHTERTAKAKYKKPIEHQVAEKFYGLLKMVLEL